jgi:antitoxin MazE
MLPLGYTLDIQSEWTAISTHGEQSRAAVMIISRVQKWGNSQGLRLPKQVLDLAEIALGEQVEIAVANHQIVVKKTARPKFELAELVRRIPKGYRTKEVDWGSPKGKEAW